MESCTQKGIGSTTMQSEATPFLVEVCVLYEAMEYEICSCSRKELAHHTLQREH